MSTIAAAPGGDGRDNGDGGDGDGDGNRAEDDSNARSATEVVQDGGVDVDVDVDSAPQGRGVCAAAAAGGGGGRGGGDGGGSGGTDRTPHASRNCRKGVPSASVYMYSTSARFFIFTFIFETVARCLITIPSASYSAVQLPLTDDVQQECRTHPRSTGTSCVQKHFIPIECSCGVCALSWYSCESR